MKPTAKQQKVLDNYVLKGMILKRVCSDIENNLDGVLDGICGEVLPDDSVVVYKLDRRGQKVKAGKFLEWKDGVVSEIAKAGRPYEVEYILPEGRSVGLFLNKAATKVLVALRA